MWTNESQYLHEWAEHNCQQVDLISSWTELVGVYKHLEFLDEINDEQRIVEFKKVVRETNRLLTRTRKALETCSDIDAAIEYLGSQFQPSRNSDVVSREDIAYQALKQRFLRQAIMELSSVRDNLFTESEDDDG